MKRVLTSNIQENLRRQPFNKATLEHLQEAFQEITASILQHFVESTGSGTFLRLYGLINSGVGTSYDISAGAVLYNGEVYQVPAFSGSHSTNVPVLNFVTEYRAGDPVTFTDNNQFNVHEINRMEISLGAPGSGAVDFSQLGRLGFNNIRYTNIDNTIAQHYFNVGSAGSPVQDWNDARKGGIASMHAGLSHAPAGTTSADSFLLIVVDSSTSNGETVQVAIQLTGSSGGGAGSIYRRTHQIVSDTWSSWNQIA